MGVRAGLLASLAVAAALLAGCGTATVIGTAGAVDVNGTNVPTPLYDSLVKAEQHRAESSGVRIDWSSKAGADRLKTIQANVLSALVRNAVIEQLADARHVAIGRGELDSSIARVEQAIGGPAALDAQLARDGLSRADFLTLFRVRLLASRLRAQDPNYAADLQAALKSARVEAYVGPCKTDHRYPACLTG